MLRLKFRRFVYKTFNDMAAVVANNISIIITGLTVKSKPLLLFLSIFTCYYYIIIRGIFFYILKKNNNKKPILYFLFTGNELFQTSTPMGDNYFWEFYRGCLQFVLLHSKQTSPPSDVEITNTIFFKRKIDRQQFIIHVF